MSEVKDNYVYSEEHEWALQTGTAIVRIGITDFAQHQLGDIVFVELPEPGTAVEPGSSIGTIESVKTVSDLFAPVSGIVVKVNDSLQESPELVNNSPYEDGWMIEVEVKGDLSETLGKLLSPDAYRPLAED